MTPAHYGIYPTSEQQAVGINTNDFYPAIKQGWGVLLDFSEQVSIGEYVLIKLKDGQQTIKTLLQAKPDGYWLQSVNTDEQTFVALQDLDGDVVAIVALLSPSTHNGRPLQLSPCNL